MRQTRSLSCWWTGLGLLIGLLLIGWVRGAGGEGVGAAAVEPATRQELRDDEAERRFMELRAEIARHDELYYRQADPEISDFEYDALKRELRELEVAFPVVAARLGELAAIGDDRLPGFEKAAHLAPMLSLEKAYSEADLRGFHQRVVEALGVADPAYRVEPKLDGIAVSLVYERGRFARAVTRGDGATGDVITENALRLTGLPRQLLSDDPPERVELRGELYASFADFERVNAGREEAGAEPFSHPRSLAAGSAKLLDAEEAAQRRLSLAIFGYGAYVPEEAEPATQGAFLERAKSWGLPVAEWDRGAAGLEELLAVVESLRKERLDFGFPTDGVVVKLDERAAQKALGDGTLAPRWAIAFKFPPDRVTTIVRDIVIQIGRTGKLTPVAELKPVALGGSRIARATLHNPSRIQRMDLRVGDTVFLEKAGEIIPAIVGVDLSKRLPDSRPYRLPTACPACGSDLDLVVGGDQWRCANSDCPAVALARLSHFASRQAVGIKGVGPATLERLVRAGRVNDPADLYDLKFEDLVEDGWGEASATRLLQAIAASREAALWRYVYGMGIAQVGPRRARALAEAFGDLEALAGLRAEDFESGGRAEGAGLGPAAVAALQEHFSVEANRVLASRLARARQATEN